MEGVAAVVTKKRLGQRFVSWLVAVAVVAGLVYGYYGYFGFGSVPASAYVGRWQLEGPDGKVATLTLGEDGSLSVENTPRVIFALDGYSEPEWQETVDLAGEWQTADNARIYVETELAGTWMSVQGRDWGMTLNIVAGGDPDNSPFFTFRRV